MPCLCLSSFGVRTVCPMSVCLSPIYLPIILSPSLPTHIHKHIHMSAVSYLEFILLGKEFVNMPTYFYYVESKVFCT